MGNRLMNATVNHDQDSETFIYYSHQSIHPSIQPHRRRLSVSIIRAFPFSLQTSLSREKEITAPSKSQEAPDWFTRNFHLQSPIRTLLTFLANLTSVLESQLAPPTISTVPYRAFLVAPGRVQS
jgi:hypothetical protein